MKKLALFAGIVLLAAACNNTTNNSNQQPNNNNSNQNSNLQTYNNATYGFSFQYPNNLPFVTPSYPMLQDKIIQVQIPGSTYPNSNFGDAAFSVSAQYAASLDACLKLTPPEGSDGFKTKVNINGVDFYMTKSSGAAAGNRYDSTVYRTVKSTGGACIELNETIHTGVIENYPAGTAQVDQTAVQSQLDQILNTFKFNS